jgi:hypothetical protein
MSEDLFEGRDDNTSSNEENYIKLEAPGAVVQLKVTDISDSFQAAHGEGYLVTGTVEVKRGDVSGPEVGEEGVYFVPLTTAQGKEHHITQELKKALKRVGKRSLDLDDTLAVKFVEQLAPKKKGMTGFKKHAVVVKAGTTNLIQVDDEAPF